jgi:hypothetical protein
MHTGTSTIILIGFILTYFSPPAKTPAAVVKKPNIVVK